LAHYAKGTPSLGTMLSSTNIGLIAIADNFQFRIFNFQSKSNITIFNDKTNYLIIENWTLNENLKLKTENFL
tara:strand:+ start:678 stop:893 length:216 start_codon:yes stop_codon:yes gene_type:complete